MTVDVAAIKSFNGHARWVLDAHRCLNLWLIDLDGRPVHAWIAPRNHYCDRGHWEFKVDAPGFYLDHSDSFPRYFMDLETAIREAEGFLRWRIYKHTDTPSFAQMLASHDGRLSTVQCDG